MLGAIAIMPAAPVLVPELAGAAADELTDLRTAVFTAVAALPPRWVAVGAGPADGVFGPDAAGSFAGFGVDVPVGLSPRAGARVDLPLCALMAGWVRGQARPDACVQVHAFTDPEAATAGGRRLRAAIERSAEPIGVLVIADGANTLTAAAPGGHHPGDAAVQRALDTALTDGDDDGLAGLPAQVVGRAGFAALAGLVGSTPRTASRLYCDAPYGVGYFAGVWQP